MLCFQGFAGLDDKAGLPPENLHPHHCLPSPGSIPACTADAGGSRHRSRHRPHRGRNPER